MGKTLNNVRVAAQLTAAFFVIALAISNVSLARGQGPARDDNTLPRPHRDPAKEFAMKITEPFTFAAVGDIMIFRPIGQQDDPRFQSLVKVMKSADMTYANMERQIIDDRDPNYHGPAAQTPPTVIDDLKSMGIRIMTTANNHSYDDGSDGIFRTNRMLTEAGITYAGSGKDLTEARKAQYGSTPKGTVGVVGLFPIDPGSLPPQSRQSDARFNWPGVNPLHVTPYNIVTAEQMAELRKIRDSSYAHRSEVRVPVAPVPPNEGPDDLFLFGTWYKVGDKTGGLSYKMNQKDLDGIIQSIRYGKAMSDFLIVAVHCHQNSFSYQAYTHDDSTPDFLVDLAHKAIDNGADVFVGTGVHSLRAVEIYKGKPIFYGISNFFFNEGPEIYHLADPNYVPPVKEESDVMKIGPDEEEALLTTSRYEGGKLAEVRLYPADLGIDGTRPLSRLGIPETPSPEQAQRMLKLVQEVSKPFGTTISIEDNVGVIRVPQTSTSQTTAAGGAAQ